MLVLSFACRFGDRELRRLCDNTPKWRKTLAARKEEGEVAEEEEEEAEDITKKLMLSPAKTIFKHN